MDYTRWLREFKILAVAKNFHRLYTGDEALIPAPPEPDFGADASSATHSQTDTAALQLAIARYTHLEKKCSKQQTRACDSVLFLYAALAPALRGSMPVATTPKGLMDAVMQRCKMTGTATRYALDATYDAIHALTLRDCSNVSDYHNQLTQLVADVKAYGGTYDEKQLKGKIIDGLSRDFTPFVDRYHLERENPSTPATLISDLVVRLSLFEARLPPCKRQSKANKH